MYTKIIRKYTENECIDNENIINAINAINKSLKMASNALFTLKTKENTELKPCLLKDLINETIELSKVYTDVLMLGLRH